MDGDAIRDVIAIDSELNKIQDSDLLLERILLEARRVVRAEAGTIYVKDGDKLHFKYSQNELKERELPPGTKLPYANFSLVINEKTISGYVAMTGQLLNIPDVYKLPSNSPYGYSSYYDEQTGYRTTSMLTLPLKTGSGKLLGVIQVINAKDETGRTRAFSKEDEVLITHFAANATVALQRAFQTRSMIYRMNRTAELRDSHETNAHVLRVAGYAAEIYDRWAFTRGIPEAERDRYKDTLKMAAMLHDIGKVAISDLILKKPARFTPEEYQVMQAHTYCGAMLFTDPESEFDRMAGEIALTHHERWDGEGYPGRVDPAHAAPRVKRIVVEGVEREVEVWDAPALEQDEEGRPRRLRGEEIPLSGRIVAVADVFDALISHRVYKESWTKDKVVAEILAQAGRQFDPEVVAAFGEVVPRLEQIRALYPDAAAR